MKPISKTMFAVQFKNGRYWRSKRREAPDFVTAGIVSTRAIAMGIANRFKGALVVPVTVSL